MSDDLFDLRARSSQKQALTLPVPRALPESSKRRSIPVSVMATLFQSVTEADTARQRTLFGFAFQMRRGARAGSTSPQLQHHSPHAPCPHRLTDRLTPPAPAARPAGAAQQLYQPRRLAEDAHTGHDQNSASRRRPLPKARCSSSIMMTMMQEEPAACHTRLLLLLHHSQSRHATAVAAAVKAALLPFHQLVSRHVNYVLAGASELFRP